MAENSRYRTPSPQDGNITHIPPHSADLEKAVLGSIMVDYSGFDIVAETLKPESFYDKKHQYIYEAIRDLAANDQPYDILAVKSRLQKVGNFDKAGGMSYLSDLLRDATGSAGIKFKAEIIAEKYIKRQLITSTSEVQTQAFDETVDAKDLMQKAQEDLYSISQEGQRKDYTQINPVLDQVYNDIQKASNNKGGISGVPTLFRDLDKITAGWQNSDLIIIAARPAMGKTAFALSMARNIAVTQRLPMAFFSLEMSNDQLVKRLVANVCEIKQDKLRSGMLEPYEWKQLDSKIGELKDAPLFVDDTSSLSIYELRTKARRLKAQAGIRLIMIDYLQLMTASGSGKFGNRQEEVSHISRSLKSLAKELNIPIIALSQVSRNVEKRDGDGNEAKRPQLSDLRESGAIEQDADMVCFIHRPEYYKIYQSADSTEDYRGKAEIIIGKHRNGEVGIVLLKFRGEYTRFSNKDDDTFNGGSLREAGSNESAPPSGSQLPPEFGGGSLPTPPGADPYASGIGASDPFGIGASDPLGGSSDGSAPF